MLHAVMDKTNKMLNVQARIIIIIITTTFSLLNRWEFTRKRMKVLHTNACAEVYQKYGYL